MHGSSPKLITPKMKKRYCQNSTPLFVWTGPVCNQKIAAFSQQLYTRHFGFSNDPLASHLINLALPCTLRAQLTFTITFVEIEATIPYFIMY